MAALPRRHGGGGGPPGAPEGEDAARARRDGLGRDARGLRRPLQVGQRRRVAVDGPEPHRDDRPAPPRGRVQRTAQRRGDRQAGRTEAGRTEEVGPASTAKRRTTRGGSGTSNAPPVRAMRVPSPLLSPSASSSASTPASETRATTSASVGFITKTTRGVPPASSCTATWTAAGSTGQVGSA